jgi:hypothetical protein
VIVRILCLTLKMLWVNILMSKDIILDQVPGVMPNG